MAKFSIIGWGSLIWEPEDLEEFGITPDAWNDDGPYLPLEFSHISRRRNGALTLVIDNQGTPCQTYWVPLDMKEWTKVESILRRREGQIDSVCRSLPKPELGNHSQIIWEWLDQHPAIEMAVWTSLSSNFEQSGNGKFSVPTALVYLEELKRKSLEGFEQAERYFQRTPSQIQTPLRTAVHNKFRDV